MRAKSVWTELPPGETGMYWKVRCLIDGCGFEEVKATKRNVELCKVGHMHGKHYGHAWNFSVVPMARTEQVKIR